MRTLTKLLLTSFVIFAFNTEYFHSTSEFSRFAMVVSMVEKGNMIIDDYVNTFPDYFHDKAYINGHYYSDKAPGPALIAFPVYLMIKNFGLDFEISVSSEDAGILGMSTIRSVITRKFLAEFLVTVLTTCILSSLLVCILYNTLLIINKKHALLITFAYMLGTTAFLYSSLFFDVQFIAFFTFAPFYMFFRRKGRKIGKRIWLFIGSLLGVALLCSYYAVISIAIIVLYMLIEVKDWNKYLVFVPISISLALMLLYNFTITGNPFKFPYAFHTLSVNAEKNYGFSIPNIMVLADFLFGAPGSGGGYLLMSPILILCILGLGTKTEEFRKERFMIFLLMLSFLLLFSAFTAGGHERYLVPLTPFLILAVSWRFERLKRFFLPFLIFSIIIVNLHLLSNSYEFISHEGVPSVTTGLSAFLDGRIINIISAAFAAYGLQIGFLSLLPLLSLFILWKEEIASMFRMK